MKQQRSLIHRSLSGAFLVLILLFSYTSTGNVAEFVHQFHAGATGYTLGICFGVTVFLSAYVASIAKLRATRVYALAIGTIFGLASASFQASIYHKGGAEWLTAILLSFIPIIVGEVGLALLESSFSKEHEADVEAAAVVQLNVQLEQLNAEHARLNTEHAEQLNAERAEHAEQTAALVDELNSLDAQLTAATRETERLNTLLNTRIVVQPKQPGPVAKQAERLDDDKTEQTLRFFTEHPGASLREAAKQIGCSAASVSGYANKLVEFDKLMKVDGKFYPAIANVPVVAVSTNGYHKTQEV